MYAVFDGAEKIVVRIKKTAVTDPYGVRINIWGEGRRSQAALNDINTKSYRHGKAPELDLSANLVGDSSQWFELPGGPVRFAIGAEYRRETASYAYDDLVSSGATFLNAITAFTPHSFAVQHAYGAWQSVVWGKSVSGSVSSGGCSLITKK